MSRLASMRQALARPSVDQACDRLTTMRNLTHTLFVGKAQTTRSGSILKCWPGVGIAFSGTSNSKGRTLLRGGLAGYDCGQGK